eukprot:177620_1
MMESKSVPQAEITEDEAKLYDRQIRVWGMEAQLRMRNSNVLIIGGGALAAEVCKNIVLAGIGKLTVLDSDLVCEAHLGAQYFLRDEDIGLKRVDCFVPRLSKLNPRVKITADNSLLCSKPDDFFKSFDLVCVTNQPLSVQVFLSEICHGSQTKFFAADSFGMTSFFFEDLGEYEYSVMRNKGENKESEKFTIKVNDVSLSESLRTGWRRAWEKCFRKRFRDAAKLFFALQIVYLYEFKKKVFADVSDREQFQELLNIRDAELEKHGMTDEVLPENILRHVASQAGGELCPVAAVVGGFLGQEILKAVSGDTQPAEPLGNWFIFSDILGGAAVVKRVTPE